MPDAARTILAGKKAGFNAGSMLLEGIYADNRDAVEVFAETQGYVSFCTPVRKVCRCPCVERPCIVCARVSLR